jgi:LysR family glycine cleavage system transcriptional activator
MPVAQRLPSLNALRAFDVVARHLSIRRAADELHVTPAAVRQQLKALETDLGLRLLQRDEGEIRLTGVAKAALADLRDGFDRIARAVQDMRAADAPRRLTVSVDPSLAATWLVPRLHRFHEQHPDIDVLLEASNALADLGRGEVDMAIRYGSPPFPGLRAVQLFDEQVFPVCSPRLRAGTIPLRKPGDLRRHTLLHLEWTPAKGEWPDWRAWLLAAGIEDIDATRGPRFTQHSMALQAAVHGQGVALASSALVADDLAAGRLVCPFDLRVATAFAYYVVAPERTADKPKIAAFRSWLMAAARAKSERTDAPSGRKAIPGHERRR